MNPEWHLSFQVVFGPDLKYGTGLLFRVKAFVISEIKPAIGSPGYMEGALQGIIDISYKTEEGKFNSIRSAAVCLASTSAIHIYSFT